LFAVFMICGDNTGSATFNKQSNQQRQFCMALYRVLSIGIRELAFLNKLGEMLQQHYAPTRRQEECCADRHTCGLSFALWLRKTSKENRSFMHIKRSSGAQLGLDGILCS